MIEAIREVLKDAAGDPVFAAAAAGSVLAALAMVTRKNPVYAALWLMVCFLSIAVLFVALNAPFLAAIHLLVYTGAILVLFLFVIMLLNLQPGELPPEHPKPVRILVGLGAVSLAGVLGAIFLSAGTAPVPFRPIAPAEVHTASGHLPVAPADWGGVAHVGQDVFARFVAPFEVVSVLIVVAIIGAVVLAKRKL